jgi:chromosome segregation ATPase
MNSQEALNMLSITYREIGNLEDAYKKARSKAHPDKGGAPEQFQKVTAAYEYLKKNLDNFNESNHNYNNSESNYYYDSNNINPNKEAFERLQRVIYDLRCRLARKDEENRYCDIRISEMLKEIDKLKSELNNKKQLDDLKQQLDNQNKTTPQNKQSFFTRITQWIKK